MNIDKKEEKGIMILKVRSNYDPEVWCFFEGVKQLNKGIHYVDDVIGSIKDMIIREDVYDYTKQKIPTSYKIYKEGFLEIWIHGKTQEDTKQILCYRPAYLLNDEGKTIERF